VVIAWAAPLTPSVLPPARDLWVIAARPFNDVRSRLGNLFTSLKASFGVVQDNYSDSLPLGRGNALDDTPILHVDTTSPGAGGPRFYWRAWVYDTFTAGRWKNTFTGVENLSPDAFDVNLPDYKARWTGEFTITPDIPIGLLYTPSHPIWVSRAVRAVVAKDDSGRVDFAAMQAAVTVFPGESYHVRATLSAASVSQLRLAANTYPDWIKTHYLQAPTVTRRTLALAQSITAPYSNAYDKTEAITAWLRQNIQYSENVPQPPADREIIDWFLFDLKQGFCNYYASAEVILLRSIGIPARMAVGYARGEASIPEDALRVGGSRPSFEGDVPPQRLTYTVRQRDAHAWPEVYFPEYGWVEFEPTVSQLPIARPLGGSAENSINNTTATPGPAIPTPAATPRSLGEADSQNSADNANSWWAGLAWMLLVVGAAALIYAGWRVSLRLNLPPFVLIAERGLRRIGLTPPRTLQAWARTAELGPVGRAYQEINQALIRLAAPADVADTPTDRVVKLARLLPACTDWAAKLLAEYHKDSYGLEPANVDLARQAGRLIRNLAWRRFLYLKLQGGSAQETTGRFSRWRST
jgi:transglutaminase-like putative cysteine protease